MLCYVIVITRCPTSVVWSISHIGEGGAKVFSIPLFCSHALKLQQSRPTVPKFHCYTCSLAGGYHKAVVNTQLSTIFALDPLHACSTSHSCNHVLQHSGPKLGHINISSCLSFPHTPFGTHFLRPPTCSPPSKVLAQIIKCLYSVICTHLVLPNTFSTRVYQASTN